MVQALAGGEVSEEAALDWLCLHVDPTQLPRRFAGNARGRAAAAGVKVLAKADESPLQHRCADHLRTLPESGLRSLLCCDSAILPLIAAAHLPKAAATGSRLMTCVPFPQPGIDAGRGWRLWRFLGCRKPSPWTLRRRPGQPGCGRRRRRSPSAPGSCSTWSTMTAQMQPATRSVAVCQSQALKASKRVRCRGVFRPKCSYTLLYLPSWS